MVYEHRSYRDFLKNVLIARKQANRSYSLRALASSLGFSSSQLSEAMNGRANFSARALIKIGKQLKLSARETDYLCAIGEFEHEQDPEAREHLLRKVERLNPKRTPFADMKLDHFKQISDWYHSAILELVYLDGFEFSVSSVARRLQISRQEAELAIDRLLRLGLLQKNGDGTYFRQVSALQIQATEKNQAMRKFYRQMFERASKALDTQTPGQRWSGYETLPIAKEALPEIARACDAFFEEILRISNRYEKKTEVYHLLMHFFRLTEGKLK